ncbi:MAG: ABC transporter substrate-binding protein, partial [Pseudomonadota bacterium]
MDINIYARPDYYFQYDNPDFQEVMAELDIATDPAERSDLLKMAQQIIADDYVNGYLFQLARTGVANADIEGLWLNAPTQANDLTGVRWTN